MKITVQFRVFPTKEQECLLNAMLREYVNTANDLLVYLSAQSSLPSLSSASFKAALPSAVKNEVIRAATSAFKAGAKRGYLPEFKRPSCSWNNQNFSILTDGIAFPVWLNGKSKKVTVKADVRGYQQDRLDGKLGAMRITKKAGNWIAQIAVEAEPTSATGESVMGVDLGLKVPAVAVTDKGKTRFLGNGRQNKVVRRTHKGKRRELGKAKRPKVIKRIENKEQRWMKDQDHKISRQVVDFAKEQGVAEIRLEQLSGIRSTARTSRKNAKNLHTWSFYRLMQFITYKAELAGIVVIQVDPRYTSQTCPVCGTKNKAKDRKYRCTCGYECHRDRLGAINIISAPVASGKRKSA